MNNFFEAFLIFKNFPISVKGNLADQLQSPQTKNTALQAYFLLNFKSSTEKVMSKINWLYNKSLFYSIQSFWCQIHQSQTLVLSLLKEMFGQALWEVQQSTLQFKKIFLVCQFNRTKQSSGFQPVSSCGTITLFICIVAESTCSLKSF